MANLRRLVERTLLIVGVLLLAIYFGVRLYQRVSSQTALATFDRELAKGPKKNRPPILVANEASDLSLWSDKRVAEYQNSLKTEFGEPLAVLSISKLQLRVPVFEGTTEPVLNRGVGWIVGSGAQSGSGVRRLLQGQAWRHSLRDCRSL